MTFIELSRFSVVRDNYFGGDDGFRLFQNLLIADPQRGDVIPGCGSVRKIRVADPRRGKGNRGGLRVVYLYVPEVKTIVLFAVYDKDEASDLTSEQMRDIASAVASAHNDLIETMRNRRR